MFRGRQITRKIGDLPASVIDDTLDVFRASFVHPFGCTKDALTYFIYASCFPKIDSDFRADALEPRFQDAVRSEACSRLLSTPNLLSEDRFRSSGRCAG